MADVGKDLALLTAGTREKFNSLTIMYGAKGMIWGKNAYFAFIKPERFTWEFINSNNYFTVSYFPPELDYIHKIFGFKSGRYADKVKEAGLTPEFLTHGISFQEAREVFECRKIYMKQFDRSDIPSEILAKYDDPNDIIHGQCHYQIIGEIINHIITIK
ncbi:MAG: hypothetical protein IJQ63_09095 [Synergistaceae bacterium]|nr:hypothetical protein [Synergistaceae bacterium]MBR0096262.1 hypothetical protein [Synergistaceae bacterium]MBR0221916.1 hypothetical protein [Synergistaceae bacterium]